MRSNPAASAAWAILTSVGPSWFAPAGQEKSLRPSPSFMKPDLLFSDVQTWNTSLPCARTDQAGAGKHLLRLATLNVPTRAAQPVLRHIHQEDCRPVLVC